MEVFASGKPAGDCVTSTGRRDRNPGARGRQVAATLTISYSSYVDLFLISSSFFPTVFFSLFIHDGTVVPTVTIRYIINSCTHAHTHTHTHTFINKTYCTVHSGPKPSDTIPHCLQIGSCRLSSSEIKRIDFSGLVLFYPPPQRVNPNYRLINNQYKNIVQQFSCHSKHSYLSMALKPSAAIQKRITQMLHKARGWGEVIA